MLTAFFFSLLEMARISLFLVVGFGLNRLHILPKGAGAGISRLDTMLFLPAMLIYNNMTEFSLADVGTYSRLVLTGAAMWVKKKISPAGTREMILLFFLCYDA